MSAGEHRCFFQNNQIKSSNMDMMGNKQRRVLNIKALLKRNWLLMSTIVSVVLGTCKPLNLCRLIIVF